MSYLITMSPHSVTGPAPTNLEILPYVLLPGGKLVLGVTEAPSA